MCLHFQMFFFIGNGCAIRKEMPEVVKVPVCGKRRRRKCVSVSDVCACVCARLNVFKK